jgi:hypothetical protein
MNESIVVNQTINQIEVIENTSTLELSTPGPQGPKGTQGVQGFGYAQLQGTQGVQGLQGPQGTQGTQGMQGVQGAQGVQGTQGTQGLLGTQGTQGVQGVQGTQGTQGVQGLQGNQGTQGVQGVQGTQGVQGVQGTQGVQGVQGTQGVQGVQGTQGTQGVQGNQGTQGVQGIQGHQGTQGVQGTQGLHGVQGIQGIQGIQGLIGDDGFVAQAEPPTNTSLLWLDTDQPASTLNLGTTSSPGILQLTDSTSSTSTTTAATPNSVKTAYDLALSKFQTLPKLSGQYFRTPNSQYALNSPSNTTTYYTPIYIDKSTTFDRIALATASTFTGTATVRLGIYNDNNGVPSTVVLDAGTVSATFNSSAYTITISQTLANGMYWLAFCQQGTAPSTGSYVGNINSQAQGNLLFNSAAGTPTNNLTAGYFQSSVTGAFATASSPTITTNTPYVWIRAA